ncbi:efflux RND transporter permease subunit [candidate division WOR-3 bacterium]|nr:efflux RND transporter permease subunit [candidate division WOR-3 bacterium]
MKLTETSVRNPVAIGVLAVAVAAVGFFSLQTLAINYLPDLTYPMVRVQVWWRGATPEEIETNIAEPIERAMATVDNLDYLESSSIEGMYTLLVNFGYGTKVDAAYQDVLAAMNRATRNLPTDIDPPYIFKADPSQLPVLEVAVASDERSLVWLRDWADNWLADRLTAVEGTAGVEILGGLKREIRVLLDPLRLQAYDLDASRVARVLFESNQKLFAGRVVVGDREFIARTVGEFENLDEIRNVIVTRTAAGQELRLADIALVEDSHEDTRIITRLDGRPCVKLRVLKQARANTVRVARDVERRLDALSGDMPPDVSVAVLENQGDYVTAAVNSVQSSALLAAVLVLVVVYLFLGRWRQVVVMAVALPLTLLACFLVMRLAGFSLNLFSLGGLVVSLGMILDNSIVILENITRRKADGVKAFALQGANEVGTAVLTATVTFLAIFLPFLFIPGLTALLFKELVLVIAAVVVISLLVALTVTPLLSDRLMRGERPGKPPRLTRGFDALIRLLTEGYARTLGVGLRRRWPIVALFLVLLALGLFLAGRAGSEFLPLVDDGRVMVKLKMPSGTSVERVDSILHATEKAVTGIPEIASMFTLVGGSAGGLAVYEIAQEGQIDIQLVPKGRRRVSTTQFISRLRPTIAKIPTPGGRLMVMQPKTRGIRQVGEQAVEVKVRGAVLADIHGYAQELAAALRRTDGLTNVSISLEIAKPEFRIRVDRTRASALGVSVSQVATSLRALVAGTVATQYRDNDQYYNVRVLVPGERITSKADIENLTVTTTHGSSIHLRDIAEVRRAVGPVEISREEQVKQVIVRADADQISVGEAAARAERTVRNLTRPSGIDYSMGGQAQMMAENQSSMGMLVIFALLFAFTILAIQFKSLRLPVLALLGIPLSLTGAFAALYLSGAAVGTTVLIGLVVMMGSITSQGVLLLTLAEEHRREGAKPLDAMLMAAPVRLRAILMTQLTTVIGLVPLALNLGEGGDILKPMAIAVIGGLLYSLAVTLFFLPAAYSLVMDRKRPGVTAVEPQKGEHAAPEEQS